MYAVEVSHVSKSYADKAAVNDLSFTVAQGEIFGLIGPNGAGKTTTIRMMLDIIKPDSGEISILGKKLDEAAKNSIGYLPEERGLYKKQRVMDTILYLASLKGTAPALAEKRAEEMLKQMDMLSARRKKIDELSKGMGQIIQFIVTIVHDPQLIVLDEPFSGLDPVNTELIKNILLDLRKQGKAIILSLHQMNQVEELSDRILMVNKGQAVLYGGLNEVKSRFRSNAVLVNTASPLGDLPGVIEKHEHKDHVELVLDGKTTPTQILELLVRQGVTINRFEIATPPLNEIFLKIVGAEEHE
jgi:ABC-2 type transport system ATP-binding protein